MPPEPRRGIIEIVSIIIPIPPIHSVIDLQNWIAFGSAEGSLITEDPVVVNPDAVSNKAFTKPISGNASK